MAFKYTLKCVDCGRQFEESGAFQFACPSKCDSLVKSHYYTQKIEPRDIPGIWRYYDWLPIETITDYEGGSVTYRSLGLARELRLENLYISFNGFWPEIDAKVETYTFKELEAVVTIQYAEEKRIKNLMIASAGSSANAFAYVASKRKFNVFILVPEKVLDDLMVPNVDEENVKLVAVKGEYSDAVFIVRKHHRALGLTFDGGGRSIARRDANGTLLLEAAEKIGKMPRHYFQAVSSGNGVIGVFEAAERLLNDGRFGKTIPKFHLSQNEPFIPIIRAWTEKRRELNENDLDESITLDRLYAKVLSSRTPLYGIKGGIFDALKASTGEVYRVTNDEAVQAAKLFEELESIDIVPAAAVALASLIKAVEQCKLSPKDEILLNISGGGLERMKNEVGLRKIKVKGKVGKDATTEELRGIFDDP